MVKIRLRRVGATKRPMYRIVAADSAAPRDGRFIETLGHYHPLTQPATVVVNRERLDHWLKNGAQPTAVVERLLKRSEASTAPEAQPVETPPPAARRGRSGAAVPAATPDAPPAVENAEEAPEGTPEQPE